MRKQFLFGAAALVIVGGVAYAENSVANPPPPVDAQTTDNAGGSPPSSGDGQSWWGHMGHRHGGGRHMQGGMGGSGMMNHQGFHLQLGNGIEVHVNCGQSEMKDCIASAQPLIDAAKAVAGAQPQTKAQ